MRKNIFHFGDLYLMQISGATMGISYAPAWVTLFQGLDQQSDIIPTLTLQLLLFL
ncbi:hypothetical protein ACHAWF_000719 [Thalassiosira exigua]